MNPKTKLLISCEHGGNLIPDWLLNDLSIPSEVLGSHRGWDKGALSVARLLSPLADAYVEMTLSRLCIELNRSPHHKDLFSFYSKKLPQVLRQRLIHEIYEPYRAKVESQLEEWLEAGFSVIHLSIHSFTPVLNGEVRNTEIGLLYDPKSQQEKVFCQQWQQKLTDHFKCRVRLNYPYRGTADGFTTYLRKIFNQKYPRRYVGIEVEMNQALFRDGLSE